MNPTGTQQQVSSPSSSGPFAWYRDIDQQQRRTFWSCKIGYGLDGMDTGEAITTDTQTFRWSFSFPLVQGFSVELRGALQHADSNMKNESVYRYNYTSSNHFLGVAWQL